MFSEASKQLAKVQMKAEEATTLQEMVTTLNAQKVESTEQLKTSRDAETKLRSKIEEMDQDNNRLESQCLSLERWAIANLYLGY